MSDLRYPNGLFVAERAVSVKRRSQLLAEMAEDPARLRAAVEDLSDVRLDTPYRPGGWTVRQVVHHLADSQMNWYVRTRLALTEDEPSVMPYDEVRWAELPDARTGPVEPSLALFESLTEAQWKRRMVHPERGIFVLETVLPMHVWHGRHHTAQIVELRRRMGWSATAPRV